MSAILFYLFTSSVAFGAVWRVDGQLGKDPTDCVGGDIWATAFLTIQKAVDCASPGDEIWVREGTYTDFSFIGGVVNVDIAVGIYGGFGGWENQRTQRDWKNRVTTIDAAQHFRSFYVQADATIDGFSMINGIASSGAPPEYPELHPIGAGIYVVSGTVSIANSTFSDNWTDNGSGGAIYGSGITITNCTFTRNQADHHGGAIYGSDLTINGCTFSENFAMGDGGAIRSSSSTISNCTFKGNVSAYSAGAIHGSSNVVTNSIFDRNGYATIAGTENTVINSTIVADSDRGIWCQSSDPWTIANSIIWGNDDYDPQIYQCENSIITHCNIDQDGLVGSNGNIRQDPLFGDPTNGDFHLLANSPCIDAGTNTAPNLPATDFEGGPRILDGDNDGTATVDMGADEVFITSTGHNLGIAVPVGGKMTNCQSADPASIQDNTNRPDDLIYGLMEMEIEADEPGGSVTVTIDLPNPAPADYKWYKYSSTHGWIDFSREVISGGLGDGAELNADRTQVTFYITDNGQYDDDPRDGFIKDPSGLGIVSATTSSGGGGGGGGCFIDTAAYGFRRVK